MNTKFSPILRVAALSALTFGLFCGQSNAQLYKSIDKDGNVTYSDTMPMTQKPGTKTIEMRKNLVADPDAAKRLKDEKAAFDQRMKDRADGEKTATAKQAQTAEQAQRCRDIQGALTQYRNTPKLYRMTENKQRVLITADEREYETKRLEGMWAEECK
jgi:hypothetical protein